MKLLVRCESCGTKNPQRVSYCLQCGRELNSDAKDRSNIKKDHHTLTGTNSKGGKGPVDWSSNVNIFEEAKKHLSDEEIKEYQQLIISSSLFEQINRPINDILNGIEELENKGKELERKSVKNKIKDLKEMKREAEKLLDLINSVSMPSLNKSQHSSFTSPAREFKEVFALKKLTWSKKLCERVTNEYENYRSKAEDFTDKLERGKRKTESIEAKIAKNCKDNLGGKIVDRFRGHLLSDKEAKERTMKRKTKGQLQKDLDAMETLLEDIRSFTTRIQNNRSTMMTINKDLESMVNHVKTELKTAGELAKQKSNVVEKAVDRLTREVDKAENSVKKIQNEIPELQLASREFEEAKRKADELEEMTDKMNTETGIKGSIEAWREALKKKEQAKERYEKIKRSIEKPENRSKESLRKSTEEVETIYTKSVIISNISKKVAKQADVSTFENLKDRWRKMSDELLEAEKTANNVYSELKKLEDTLSRFTTPETSQGKPKEIIEQAREASEKTALAIKQEEKYNKQSSSGRTEVW